MRLEPIFNRTQRVLFFLLGSPAVRIPISIIFGFLVPYLIITRATGLPFLNPEQQFINMLGRGSVYSLFALGYALVFSILGLLNLAHSSVYMWGAFGGWYAVAFFGWPIWAALPAGMVVGGIAGILVDWAAFWMLRRRDAPRTSQLISSIGAAIILVNLGIIAFRFVPEPALRNFPQRFPREKIAENRYFDNFPLDMEDLVIAGQTVWEDVPFIVRPIQLTSFVVAMLLMFLLQYLVTQTKIGKAMRTVAYSQRTARLLGINVGYIFALTFFLAGALGGAAGVLQGITFNVEPFMGDKIALVGLTVIVLGGLGSIEASVIGAFLVANMQIATIATGYGWLEEAIVFVALFLTLIIRPRGLMGEAVQDRA